jgi:hypothetical protein
VSNDNDVFTVFISHKHEDHALAVTVKDALEALSPGHVDCFVSGVDITAGMDWRTQIRTELAQSHLLLLLFTAPSKNWDWCLYEAGLYTRFDKVGAASVVCIFNAVDASPSPLADLQGVPADTASLRAFLEQLCRHTLALSDDWRHGALAPDVTVEELDRAASAIAGAFGRAGSASTYYPCHRLVLSLTETDDFSAGIPESAIVVESIGSTSSFTMSLFDLAAGTGRRTWGDLLQAVDGHDAPWRKELDANFLRALREQLFPPSQEVLTAGDRRGDGRCYSVILYSVVRGPAISADRDEHDGIDRLPRNVTIVLHPHLSGSGGRP